MSHMRMSHVTHVNESCHTYRWVMSHMSMSHVTHVNESRHAREWVVSVMWMGRVTYVNESCLTSQQIGHARARATWLIHECNLSTMINLCVCLKPFRCLTVNNHKHAYIFTYTANDIHIYIFTYTYIHPHVYKTYVYTWLVMTYGNIGVCVLMHV